MNSVTFNSIMTGCGVKSFNGAASYKPEDIIESFVKIQMGSGKVYDVATHKYVESNKVHFSDCFVLWSDFDRTTCAGQCSPVKPTVEAPLSGAKFAAYIREHNLGEVTVSPGRHNPLHPERLVKDPVTGEVNAVGLLHVYIWAVDPIALTDWYQNHKKTAEAAEAKRQAELAKKAKVEKEVKAAVQCPKPAFRLGDIDEDDDY